MEDQIAIAIEADSGGIAHTAGDHQRRPDAQLVALISDQKPLDRIGRHLGRRKLHVSASVQADREGRIGGAVFLKRTKVEEELHAIGHRGTAANRQGVGTVGIGGGEIRLGELEAQHRLLNQRRRGCGASTEDGEGRRDRLTAAAQREDQIAAAPQAGHESRHGGEHLLGITDAIAVAVQQAHQLGGSASEGRSVGRIPQGHCGEECAIAQLGEAAGIAEIGGEAADTEARRIAALGQGQGVRSRAWGLCFHIHRQGANAGLLQGCVGQAGGNESLIGRIASKGIAEIVVANPKIRPQLGLRRNTEVGAGDPSVGAVDATALNKVAFNQA